jgi:hypothetical protein
VYADVEFTLPAGYVRRVLRLALALALITGCGRVAFNGPLEIVDEFDAGTLDMLELADGLVLVADARAGEFTSRVFERPSEITAWTSLQWLPDAPYHKALPDARAIESGYPHGNADMRGTIALLHLDGTGAVGVGSSLADASGRGNDFVAVATARPGTSLGYVPGVIEGGLAKDVDLAFFHDVGDTGDFQFGASDFTWVAWVKSSRCTADNSTYWGSESPSASPHIWMGCCTPENTVGGYFRGSSGTGLGGCSGGMPIIDNSWHHVAVVKSATSPTTVRLGFVLDGVPDLAVTETTDPDATWDPVTRFGFTSFEISAYPDSAATGTFDEAAVWTRGLDDAELRGVYERGALDVTLQVRFCAQADCTDGGPFVGPDGTIATVFRDPSGTIGPPEAMPLAGAGDVRRPYFQYRANFTTLHDGATPRLHSVTIRGD